MLGCIVMNLIFFFVFCVVTKCLVRRLWWMSLLLWTIWCSFDHLLSSNLWVNNCQWHFVMTHFTDVMYCLSRSTSITAVCQNMWPLLSHIFTPLNEQSHSLISFLLIDFISFLSLCAVPRWRRWLLKSNPWWESSLLAGSDFLVNSAVSWFMSNWTLLILWSGGDNNEVTYQATANASCEDSSLLDDTHAHRNSFHLSHFDSITIQCLWQHLPLLSLSALLSIQTTLCSTGGMRQYWHSAQTHSSEWSPGCCTWIMHVLTPGCRATPVPS